MVFFAASAIVLVHHRQQQNNTHKTQSKTYYVCVFVSVPFRLLQRHTRRVDLFEGDSLNVR